MNRFLVLVVLLCTLFASFTSAANYFCLGEGDSIKTGQQCAGSGLSCERGNYCDDAGICSANIAIGGKCLYNSDCVEGAKCQGTLGSKICVGFAGIGQRCDTNETTTTPFCGSGYTCDVIELVCTGGKLGDTCKNNADVDVCSGELQCKGSICTGAAIDKNCTSHSDCLATLFCDNSFSQPICRERKIEGSCYQSSLVCAPGYVCVSSGDGDNEPICIPEKTRKPGQWCGRNGDAVPLACETLRCAEHESNGGHYCSSGRSMFTGTSPNNCAEDEVNTCAGLIFDGGHFQCTPNPCYELEKNFGSCIQENCMQCSDPRCLRDYVYEISEVPGQCYLNHCEEQYQKMRECNDAGQVMGSVFVAALIAFFSTLVSRKF